jgi:hypothetical protein
MYIDRWVYNPLSKWARRNKGMIINMAIAIGVMMIPIGFLMMTNDKISMWWIAFVGIVGFISLFWAAKRAEKEDKRTEERHQELIKAIKSINTRL